MHIELGKYIAKVIYSMTNVTDKCCRRHVGPIALSFDLAVIPVKDSESGKFCVAVVEGSPYSSRVKFTVEV